MPEARHGRSAYLRHPVSPLLQAYVSVSPREILAPLEHDTVYSDQGSGIDQYVVTERILCSRRLTPPRFL